MEVVQSTGYYHPMLNPTQWNTGTYIEDSQLPLSQS